MNTQTRTRVVVIGGGFAGLESAFLIRAKLGKGADITLIADTDRFLFKPNTIYIPFGAKAESLMIPLAKPTAKRNIRLIQASFESLDPERRTVRAGGWEVPFDFLVLATGAGMRPEEIPGLAEHAETIWTPGEMSALGTRLRGLVDRARMGTTQRLLFAVPPNNKCAGPLYEMVMMSETWLRRAGVRDRVEIAWTTFEQTYVQAFGPKLHDVVGAEFTSRGIAAHTGWRISRVEPGCAHYDNGEHRDFDLLVAFPPYVSAVRYDGLPADDRGFLQTDPGWRRVQGQERIFAPGDAGDFPVKQAFLAFLQADAVAEAVAAEVMGHEPVGAFDPVSMCVMEEFNTATFAQVPLQTTGDPQRPVEVRPDADGAYKVGVSPLWRLGKKALGIYLPLRFRNGLPFHQGAPWTAMELGLKGMAGVLARK
jgi:sulfide:quinone oxidoreductase